jgi:hypothetical protein
LGTQLSWLEKGPLETGEELRLYPWMSGVEAQAEVEDQDGRWQEEGPSEDQTVDYCESMTVEEKVSLAECRALCMTVADPAINPWGSQYRKIKEAWERVLSEVNGQGHFLGKKYGFIQSRVNELLMLHTGDAVVRVTHGLTEKSVRLPPISPLSVVDRYLIALQVGYLGGPLDKILELKARGHPTSLKRTVQDAYLDEGLPSRILSLGNHNTQTQLSSQSSNTIAGMTIEYLQSLYSSPPSPKHVSTAELAAVFSRATEEREEKQNRFQEELLAEMGKQTAAVEEMVRVVKELYIGKGARA